MKKININYEKPLMFSKSALKFLNDWISDFGRKEFSEFANIGYNTLCGKLTAKKRSNGDTEKIFPAEFEKWCKILTGEKLDWEFMQIASIKNKKQFQRKMELYNIKKDLEID